MKTILTANLLCLCLLAPAGASTLELIQNGDFESGTTSSWNRTALTFGPAPACQDSFAAQSAGIGCIGGISPVGSAYAAYSSTSYVGSGTGIANLADWLNQNITVPNATILSAILTWDDTATWNGLDGEFFNIGPMLFTKDQGTFINARGTTTALAWQTDPMLGQAGVGT